MPEYDDSLVDHLGTKPSQKCFHLPPTPPRHTSRSFLSIFQNGGRSNSSYNVSTTPKEAVQPTNQSKYDNVPTKVKSGMNLRSEQSGNRLPKLQFQSRNGSSNSLSVPSSPTSPLPSWLSGRKTSPSRSSQKNLSVWECSSPTLSVCSDSPGDSCAKLQWKQGTKSALNTPTHTPLPARARKLSSVSFTPDRGKLTCGFPLGSSSTLDADDCDCYTKSRSGSTDNINQNKASDYVDQTKEFTKPVPAKTKFSVLDNLRFGLQRSRSYTEGVSSSKSNADKDQNGSYSSASKGMQGGNTKDTGTDGKENDQWVFCTLKRPRRNRRVERMKDISMEKNVAQYKEWMEETPKTGKRHAQTKRTRSFRKGILPFFGVSPGKNSNVIIKVQGKANNDGLDRKVEDVTRALQFYQDTVEKNIIDMLPGSATVVLEMILAFTITLKTTITNQNSSEALSRMARLNQSLADLVQWSDLYLLKGGNTHSPLSVQQVVEAVREAVRALVTFAEDKDDDSSLRDHRFLKTSISSTLDNNNSICSDIPSSPSYSSGSHSSMGDVAPPLPPKKSKSSPSNGVETPPRQGSPIEQSPKELHHHNHSRLSSGSGGHTSSSTPLYSNRVSPASSIDSMNHSQEDVLHHIHPDHLMHLHHEDKIPQDLISALSLNLGLKSDSTLTLANQMHLSEYFPEAVACTSGVQSFSSSSVTSISHSSMKTNSSSTSHLQCSSQGTQFSSSSMQLSSGHMTRTMQQNLMVHRKTTRSSTSSSSSTLSSSSEGENHVKLSVPPALPEKKKQRATATDRLTSQYDNVPIGCGLDRVDAPVSPRTKEPLLPPKKNNSLLSNVSCSSIGSMTSGYVSEHTSSNCSMISTTSSGSPVDNAVLLRRQTASATFRSSQVIPESDRPPDLPPKRKKHVNDYMECIGTYKEPSTSDFLRHSAHQLSYYQQHYQRSVISASYAASTFHSSPVHSDLQTMSLNEQVPPIPPKRNKQLSIERRSSSPITLPPSEQSHDITYCSIDPTPSQNILAISQSDDELACHDRSIEEDHHYVKDSSPIDSPRLPPYEPFALNLGDSTHQEDELELEDEEEEDGKERIIDLLDVKSLLLLKKDGEEGPEIRGGPADALIVYAASTAKNELLYQEAFLTTYRTYITPLDLVNKLLYRYNKFIKSSSIIKQKAARNAFSLLVRVVDDLSMTDVALNAKNDILETLATFEYNLLCKGELQLGRMLRRKIVEKLEIRKKFNTPPYLFNHTTLSPASMTKVLTDYKSQDIAQQMTLLDAELFQKVEIPEVLIYAQEQIEELSPNLATFTEHFNKMSYWVRSRILEQSEKEREKYVLKFIKIMRHLRRMNNFNSYLALLSALDSAPIRRLEWKQTITDGLKEYCALIDSSSSFRAYRQALAESCSPCIPYIGLILQDLTFVHIGNNDAMADGNINFSKRWQQFNILDNMKRFKKSQYNFKKNEEIMEFFDNFNDYKSEEELWTLSEQIRPRGGRQVH